MWIVQKVAPEVPVLGPVWRLAKDSRQGVYVVPAAINSTKLSRVAMDCRLHWVQQHGLHCTEETTRITL